MSKMPERLAVEAMGTRFELVIEAADVPRAAWRSVGESAFEPVLEWHSRLNRFDRGSLVSLVNRTGVRDSGVPDAEFVELLEVCDRLLHDTRGAFDVCIGNRLDFGGIAKGFVIDQAIEVLRECGVRSAIMHGGTSTVGTIGVSGDGTPWRVALGVDPGAPSVDLADQAVSVSGHRTGVPREACHIQDPRTGAPAGGELYSACVRGRSALRCDAWSTATLVLGDDLPASAHGFDVWCASHDGSWRYRACDAKRGAGIDIVLEHV